MSDDSRFREYWGDGQENDAHGQTVGSSLEVYRRVGVCLVLRNLYGPAAATTHVCLHVLHQITPHYTRLFIYGSAVSCRTASQAWKP
jgi:hypothetical protein